MNTAAQCTVSSYQSPASADGYKIKDCVRIVLQSHCMRKLCLTHCLASPNRKEIIDKHHSLYLMKTTTEICSLATPFSWQSLLTKWRRFLSSNVGAVFFTASLWLNRYLGTSKSIVSSFSLFLSLTYTLLQSL